MDPIFIGRYNVVLDGNVMGGEDLEGFCRPADLTIPYCDIVRVVDLDPRGTVVDIEQDSNPGIDFVDILTAGPGTASSGKNEIVIRDGDTVCNMIFHNTFTAVENVLT